MLWVVRGYRIGCLDWPSGTSLSKIIDNSFADERDLLSHKMTMQLPWPHDRYISDSLNSGSFQLVYLNSPINGITFVEHVKWSINTNRIKNWFKYVFLSAIFDPK